ncbi:MAG TPA: DUF2065 domain-containing protein [Sulfuriferula sp.]|nr:DUF2065 domain-containing protein [Sulfuriferula sp.]
MSGGKLPATIAPKRVPGGVLPLQLPNSWRETLRKMAAPNDGQLRFAGRASMLSGLLILLASHSHA